MTAPNMDQIEKLKFQLQLLKKKNFKTNTIHFPIGHKVEPFHYSFATVREQLSVVAGV